MPHVVNGIGTWYYGKRKQHTIRGTCTFCKAHADLASYDTTKYFVVFFVPLVPISSWRIIEDCPVCQKHRAAKLKEWERQKEEAIAAMTESLRQSPDSSEAVRQAIATACMFQDGDLLRPVGEHLAGPMTQDFDVQTALGDAYGYFSQHAEAARCYRAALDVRDEDHVREVLAVQLLKLRRPAEAAPFLEHVREAKDPARVGYLLLLLEGWQAEARFDEAATIRAECEQLSPALLQDKQYLKDRKRAEKFARSGRPVPLATLAESKQAGYREAGSSGRIARIVGPVVAAMLLLGYLFAAWRGGQAREVFVVNGLTQPYTATIAGQTVELTPGLHRRITIPEGDTSVAVEAAGVDIAPQTVSIATSFWLRPFRSHTFVINPDRTGVLMWEKVWYTAANNADIEPEMELHAGDSLYEFRGIDYVFEEFPMELQMSGNKLAKTRVGVFPKHLMSPEQVLGVLSTSLPPESLQLYLRNWAESDLDNDLAVFALASMAPPESYLEWARPRLVKRPVAIELHRAYQTLMQRTHPEHDLVDEYRALQQEQPDDASLCYLLGRVAPDSAESERLYRVGVDARPPQPHSLNALAYQYVCDARFEEALPLAVQACQLRPDSVSFRQTCEMAQRALGRFADLLRDVAARNTSGDQSFLAMMQEVSLLVANGDVPKARQRYQSFLAAIGGDAGGETGQMTALIEQVFAYAEGNMEEYSRLVTQANGGQPNFEAAFAVGDWKVAASALSADDDKFAYRQLSLYLAWTGDGDAAQAATHLEAAVNSLRTLGDDERLVADALAAETAVPIDPLLHVAILPSDKRIALAALGTRFPDSREVCFNLARKLNFDPSLPSWFLKAYLEK